MAEDEEFWRLPKVIEKSGLSRPEIYRRINSGTFPAGRHYRGSNPNTKQSRSTYWLASEVRAWQAEELAAAC